MTAAAPSLFIGHGSPMNAIESNTFTKALSDLGQTIAKPRAILCISAHWLTEGTWVTSMTEPRTIHDFRGFPKELFAVNYTAKGDPEVARLIQSTIKTPNILLDASQWGLDHGAWSVLLHLFPKGDVPVLQMSINMNMPADFHLELGAKLRELRKLGILILGSGNIVHNLQKIKWNDHAIPYDWAFEFDMWVKEKIEKRDFKSLTAEFNSSSAILSVPTPDHYYPMLYALGATFEDEPIHFEYEAIELGSISMRSFSAGLN